VLPECRLLQRGNDGASTAIHLTDLLGPCFTALRFGADAAHDDAWQQLQRTLAERGIPFKAVTLVKSDTPCTAAACAIDPTGHVHDTLDATPGTVYLIRPDGHVLARWRNGSAAAAQRALTATLTI
jgi:3-(3-hydroxy-phenyl)propionate hydroxylase